MLITTVYGQVFLLVFLLIFCFFDLKTMQLDLRLFLFSLSLLSACYLFYLQTGHALSGRELGLAALTCFSLLIFSVLSREALGLGDALFFFIVGLTCGFTRLILILLFSFGGAGIFSLMFIAHETICGRSCKSKRIPFIPFTAPILLFFLLQAGGLL